MYYFKPSNLPTLVIGAARLLVVLYGVVVSQWDNANKSRVVPPNE